MTAAKTQVVKKYDKQLLIHGVPISEAYDTFPKEKFIEIIERFFETLEQQALDERFLRELRKWNIYKLKTGWDKK